MKTKGITTMMTILFLVSIASSVTFALPTGSAHWSNKESSEGKFSVQLTVRDGASRIVAVVIPVDVELDAIDQLEFMKKVTEFTAGWNPSILLGIDLDGDGKYRAKDFEWQFSVDVGYAPELLRGDTFIQGEATRRLTTPETDWSDVNAYADYYWFTPDTDGVGYFWDGTHGYNKLDHYQEHPIANIPTDAKVKVIKILIGGSTSWMAEVAFVDRLLLNGDGTILDEPRNSKAAFEIVTRD